MQTHTKFCMIDRPIFTANALVLGSWPAVSDQTRQATFKLRKATLRNGWYKRTRLVGSRFVTRDLVKFSWNLATASTTTSCPERHLPHSTLNKVLELFLSQAIWCSITSRMWRCWNCPSTLLVLVRHLTVLTAYDYSTTSSMIWPLGFQKVGRFVILGPMVFDTNFACSATDMVRCLYWRCRMASLYSVSGVTSGCQPFPWLQLHLKTMYQPNPKHFCTFFIVWVFWSVVVVASKLWSSLLKCLCSKKKSKSILITLFKLKNPFKSIARKTNFCDVLNKFCWSDVKWCRRFAKFSLSPSHTQGSL
jgi:hypothetical protein